MRIGDRVHYAYRQSATDDGELKLLDFAIGVGRIVSYDSGPTVVIDNGVRIEFVDAKHVHEAEHMVRHLCDDLNAGRKNPGFAPFTFVGDVW